MADALTVILADDHPLVLRGLADLLSGNEGIRVIASCRNGQAAFAAAQEHRPDIALVDVNMPEMDGLAFLAAVQASGLPTRVILLTAELWFSASWTRGRNKREGGTVKAVRKRGVFTTAPRIRRNFPARCWPSHGFASIIPGHRLRGRPDV